MTLHSLVLRCDTFSCHCNSIIPSLSIVIQEQFSHFSSFLRLYKSQCIFHTVSQFNHSSYMCSNVSRSTRINSSNVHMYILRLFYIASSIRIYILINPIFNMVSDRGCSYRSNPAVSCISPNILNNSTVELQFYQHIPRKGLQSNSSRQNLHSKWQQGSPGFPCSFPVLPSILLSRIFILCGSGIQQVPVEFPVLL